MPKKSLSAIGYQQATNVTFSKGRFGAWTATFTCPLDDKSGAAKLRQVKDESGRLFPGVICDCGQVLLFRDRHGNSIRWGADYAAIPMRTVDLAA